VAGRGLEKGRRNLHTGRRVCFACLACILYHREIERGSLEGVEGELFSDAAYVWDMDWLDYRSVYLSRYICGGGCGEGVRGCTLSTIGNQCEQMAGRCCDAKVRQTVYFSVFFELVNVDT